MKRDPAVKIPITALHRGELRRDEGEFAPTTLHLESLSFSRANVMGVVITTGRETVIEDGTERITLRSFEPVPGLDGLSVGDATMIIGKPREYNGQRYLMPEIAKRIDPAWLTVRKKELSGFTLPEEDPPEEEVVTEETETGTDAVVSYLKEHDTGNGVERRALLAALPTGTDAIEALLRDGELFENMPGRLKLLE